MQNKELTVISSEIRQGSRNLRTRRTQSLKGGIITFTTSGQVFEKDVFSLHFNDKDRYYKVEEISTIDKDTVEVAAVETGYFSDKSSRQPNFDVRSLIDKEVTKITDEKLIANIQRASNFT